MTAGASWRLPTLWAAIRLPGMLPGAICRPSSMPAAYAPVPTENVSATTEMAMAGDCAASERRCRICFSHQEGLLTVIGPGRAGRGRADQREIMLAVGQAQT